MTQSPQQARPSGGRVVGQSEDDHAIIRLTGQQHTLYRPVHSLLNTNGRLYQLMDGRRIRCSGSGPQTVAEWA